MALAVAYVAFVSCLTGTRPQEDVTYPPDANVVDVTKPPYGAKGDGTADDTPALRKALEESAKRRGCSVLYFPRGTYRVSDTLGWVQYLTLQGQSRTGTVIRLQDRAPGFQDPLSPKPVVFAGQSDPDAKDGLNTGFNNNIFNLTVEVGAGNAGAVGIEYCGHNQSSVRDVTIRTTDGKGHAGLSMVYRWPGPGLVKNLRVVGFEYGIDVDQRTYGLTLEHVVLENFGAAGIRNRRNVLSVRDLKTRGNGPALRNVEETRQGAVTLLDASLEGGSPSAPAIENDGILWLRNVKAVGYSAVVPGEGNSVKEFRSHPAVSFVPSASTSLGLPVQEAPDVGWPRDFSDWANVRKYGADPNDENDDAPGIQAAIDSGKSVVYLPRPEDGRYRVHSTVVVRGKVRRVVGFLSGLWPDQGLLGGPNAVLRIEPTEAPAVVLEGISGFRRPPALEPVWIEHASAKPLVLRHCGLTGGLKAYRALPGAGDLFIEDVVAGGWFFAKGQRVWARQFNTEYEHGESMVVNAGAHLWILGLKTEKANTVLDTRDGGRTEVLGGFIYAGKSADAYAERPPLFVTRGSEFCAVNVVSYGNLYPRQVVEWRGDRCETLPVEKLSDRGRYNKVIPLFRTAPVR